MTDCDVLVVGAGIAGAGAAYAIAARRRVVVLERESQPGYHTTGRSAAWFTETYGNATIRRLVRAARPFLEAPPAGFATHPLLVPGDELMVASAEEVPALEAHYAESRALCPGLALIDGAEARRRVPVLKPEAAVAAMHDPDCADMDVAGLHQGFLKGLRARGGQVVCDAEVTALERRDGAWQAETRAGAFRAPILVDAAGAWADALAAQAGVAPLGITPMRRTVITFEPPPELSVHGWPMVGDASETWYLKPDAGRLLASPADATPTPPADAQPEELDIATVAWRIEQATTLSVGRIGQSWAGLRSFVPDGSPVVGFDPSSEGFFWLAAQGGYGIKTAEPLGRLAAALIEGEGYPPDLAVLGLGPVDLGPERLAR